MITKSKNNNNSNFNDLSSQPNVGHFLGYSVAYCSPSEIKVEIRQWSNAEDAETQKSLESYRVDSMVVLESDTIKEFIKSYLGLCFSKLGSLFDFQCLDFRLASVNGDIFSGIHNLFILQRLQQIGIFRKSQESVNAPIITNGPFIVSDKFELMQKDEVVGQVFNKIKKITGFLIDHDDSCLNKLNEFEHNPNIITRNFRSNNLTEPKNLQGSSLLIFNNKNSTGLDVRNTGDRLQLKACALLQERKNFEKDKEKIVNQITHNKKIWNTINLYAQSFYPSKFTAYLVFENLLNHACDAYKVFEDKFEGNRLRLCIQSHELRIVGILTECLSLLYPYAKEVAMCFNIDLNQDKNLQFLLENSSIYEYFGINLANDKHLDLLPKLNGVLSRSLEDEIAQYDEYDRIVSELNKKKLQTKNNTQIRPSVKESKVIVNDKIDEKEALSANQENPAKPEVVANEDTMEEDVKLSQNEKKEEDASCQIQDEIATKSKKEKKNPLNPQRAEKILSDYKSALEEDEKIKEAKRIERLKRLYDLPSAEFVKVKIVNHFNQGKGGKNADYFKMLFGLIDNKRTMSNENVLNLTTYITTILTNNNIGCAKDFSNEVKARTHYRHKDGNLLPEFYVNVLRSTCIIFGIFPEDWKPKTVADFNAMTKYEQRCKDIERFEIKNLNKKKS